MSQNIFDIFVRSYEDDSPVATLTIGLDLNSASAENDIKDDVIPDSANDQDIQSQVKRRQYSKNQTMIFDIKEMIYQNALPEYQILPER